MTARSLFRLQQLEELYLSGNKLMSLPPDDLERLVNLRLIYLNGNKVSSKTTQVLSSLLTKCCPAANTAC